MRLKLGCRQGYVPPGALGENATPCLFQLLEATCIPWLVVSNYSIVYHSFYNLYFLCKISCHGLVPIIKELYIFL